MLVSVIEPLQFFLEACQSSAMCSRNALGSGLVRHPSDMQPVAIIFLLCSPHRPLADAAAWAHLPSSSGGRTRVSDRRIRARGPRESTSRAGAPGCAHPRSLPGGRLWLKSPTSTRAHRQACGRRWHSNRREKSHQPFRRRERATLRFRRMATMQKFTSVHASFHNHFNHERHVIDRNSYKSRRSAAMVAWRNFAS